LFPLAWFGRRNRKLWVKPLRFLLMIFIVLKTWIVIRNLINCKPQIEEVRGKTTLEKSYF
jgi:hypothetical protein